MKYCKKCVQPDTRPGAIFCDDGICFVCKYSESKNKIDWKERKKQLEDIAKWAKKNNKTNYDCVVGVSGGKDSLFQALYVKEELGLNVLLVNCVPEKITDVGKKNLENLTQKGFDIFMIRPNPKIMKQLIKKSFYKYGNPIKPSEYPLYAVAYQVALAQDIPLIIEGENPGITFGATEGVGMDGNALNINLWNTLAGCNADDWIGDGIERKELSLYQFPDKNTLNKHSIKALYLNYYVREWGYSYNTEFAIKHGLMGRPNHNSNETGRLNPYCAVDSDFQIVNQLLKFIKFGFGYVTDEVCYWIREGKMSRNEGIELVKKYDGKCADKYVMQFCDYINISINEFWHVANSFRGLMWRKDSKKVWSLKDSIY